MPSKDQVEVNTTMKSYRSLGCKVLLVLSFLNTTQFPLSNPYFP